MTKSKIIDGNLLVSQYNINFLFVLANYENCKLKRNSINTHGLWHKLLDFKCI